MIEAPPKQRTDKPEYRVQSMTEIAELPRNGYKAVSTFSGCGGSCLGFEMAGFEILWASEFVEAARDTYRLNHPGVTVDERDIRQVTPEEILERTGLKRGELDVLEGSPPCANFSTAGKRAASWGQVKAYSDTKQRSDDLFFEFVRILDGLQPRVFVAENVSGLVKGVAKGYFIEILAAMKACGYRVSARLLDAQWLGVPQQRQRIIFVGVRNDLDAEPSHPKPLPYRYSVRDAIPWITNHGIHPAGTFTPEFVDSGKNPSPAILTAPASGSGLVEARVIHDTHGEPKYSSGDITDRPSPTVVAGGGMSHYRVETRAYLDKRGAFGNDSDCTDTPAPTVLADSVGTHWIEEPSSGWNAEDRRSVRVDPNDVAPTILHHGRGWNQIAIENPRPTGQRVNGDPHKGHRIARSGDHSPTVLAQDNGFSDIAVSARHTEKRKFTIAELRRICAFPDDFVLTGTYAQQWERLGRAVPPLMMRAVAETVRDEILRKLDTSA